MQKTITPHRFFSCGRLGRRNFERRGFGLGIEILGPLVKFIEEQSIRHPTHKLTVYL